MHLTADYRFSHPKRWYTDFRLSKIRSSIFRLHRRFLAAERKTEDAGKLITNCLLAIDLLSLLIINFQMPTLARHRLMSASLAFHRIKNLSSSLHPSSPQSVLIGHADDLTIVFPSSHPTSLTNRTQPCFPKKTQGHHQKSVHLICSNNYPVLTNDTNYHHLLVTCHPVPHPLTLHTVSFF